ncbi:MAG: hypothetical protein LBE90_15255 [Pantoea dispersa]|nr:hypothetical protein [Pantoea dispersa]MBZ6391845.1 hypothetical protein [Pantoea dispersa]
MAIEELIDLLIEQGEKSVWFYLTEDCNGSKLFQLLDQFGGELAWRWAIDGPERWRNQMSSLTSYSSRPANADEFDLEHDRFMIQSIDALNGSAPLSRPGWCS